MKWSGEIGYSDTVETAPSVWTDMIVEKHHYGTVIQHSINNQTTDKKNDDIVLNNSISIVATPYATQNFTKMLYITFMGAKWKISKATIQYPRIIISLGEVYNG